MRTCTCGSTEFTVTYPATVRITVTDSIAASVTYQTGPDSLWGATVTCAACEAFLDVDDTLTLPDPTHAPQAPSQGVVVPFRLAREQAATLVEGLPAVTVHARQPHRFGVPAAGTVRQPGHRA